MLKKKLVLSIGTFCAVNVLLLQLGHRNVLDLSWNFKPKHIHLVFVKTHKTASSTMQNILFRFAERHNLTVVLPSKRCGGHQFCYPGRFNAKTVSPQTLPGHIVTNHMRFNKPELDRLMPNDTAYVTIMREPSTMFESLFTYYSRYCQSFRNQSLKAFLDDTSTFYRPNDVNSMYARNCLTHDLGGEKDRSDVAYAQNFAAKMEKEFKLVMISDYFDESLILLRHLLNWEIEDIVYFKSNMRSERSKKKLTPELSAKIRAWNSVDSHLYDHFNASLWRQLSALGLDFVEKEVQLLRQAQEKLMKTCFGEEKPLLRSASQIKDRVFKPWQPGGKVDVVGYELSPNVTDEARTMCTKLIMPELQYTASIQKSQALRYKEIHIITDENNNA